MSCVIRRLTKLLLGLLLFCVGSLDCHTTQHEGEPLFREGSAWFHQLPDEDRSCCSAVLSRPNSVNWNGNARRLERKSIRYRVKSRDNSVVLQPAGLESQHSVVLQPAGPGSQHSVVLQPAGPGSQHSVVLQPAGPGSQHNVVLQLAGPGSQHNVVLQLAGPGSQHGVVLQPVGLRGGWKKATNKQTNKQTNTKVMGIWLPWTEAGPPTLQTGALPQLLWLLVVA